MMTLDEFATTADRYGADLTRWPLPLQADAQTLLSQSAQAQAILAQARSLDELLAAAGRQTDSALWPSPLQKDAALARLRTGVAARIARQSRTPAVMGFASPWRWLALAAAGSSAVFAGFLLGSLLYASHAASPVDGLLTALQPVPIPFAVQ